MKKINNDKEINQIVVNSMKEIGISDEDLHWNDKGHLELKRPNDLKLHSFMLKMEKLGLNLKLTKQTLIEIE